MVIVFTRLGAEGVKDKATKEETVVKAMIDPEEAEAVVKKLTGSAGLTEDVVDIVMTISENRSIPIALTPQRIHFSIKT